MDSLRCELIHDKSQVRVTMVQMPAMNTPQFDWIKSRLPKKAQPVPPIFQPDVAAEAILYASRNDRREIYVGIPSVKAIIGNKLFTGLLDHYLAHSGYKGQQTDEPQDPNQRYNLYEPVLGSTTKRSFRSPHRAFETAPLLAHIRASYASPKSP
jgi:hypothetical protein